MSPGPTEVGRGRAIRIFIVLIALSACLGAVVAYGASRPGGERTGLAERAAVPVPSSVPDGKTPRAEALPRVSLIEVPAATSTSSQVQFRFHVAPRSQRRQPPSSPAPAGDVQRSQREFRCRYDGGPWRECSSPHRIDALATGSHSFAVRALTRSGRAGAASSYSWLRPEPKPIVIEAADAVEDLHPGFPAQPLPVTVSNPNDVPIQVTELAVEIGADSASCSRENFELTPAGASAASPLAIPAGGSASLPSGDISAPTIRMLNLPVDQDTCQGARLQLIFRGEAHG